MSGREKHAPPSRFAIGDLVRVKAGAVDPDFPDIPLGGWKGTVTEISQDPPLYLIRWDQQTLDAIHPVYRHRCERDGLDCEAMYLPESELEPETGEPTAIEQPTHVQARPLSMEDQEDRVRAVFGLTSDDPLPDADEDSSHDYFMYLAGELSFPFEADWEHASGPVSARKERVTVVGLSESEDEPVVDDMYGLLCRCRRGERITELPLTELIVQQRGRNRQLVKDYSFWSTNW